MNAPAKCCPLCGQVAAQLNLGAVNFLKSTNKRAAILRLIRDDDGARSHAKITARY